MKPEKKIDPRKRQLLFGAMLIIVGLFVLGCSEARYSSLSMVDDQGDHPGGWTDGHPTYAVPAASLCTDCHGDSLGGGITDTSCLQSECHHDTISSWATTPDIIHGDSAKKKISGSFGLISCQICHSEDFTGSSVGATPPPSCLQSACHGTAADPNNQPPHPTSWLKADTYFHTDTKTDNASVCEDCHRDGLNSPIAPPSPAASPSMAAGCYNDTLCHAAVGTPHLTNPYDSHPADAIAEFATNCNVCHSLDPPPPSPNAAAPECTDCHAGGSPLAITNCTSCHAKPPDSASPVGAVVPNIGGAHTEHNALVGVTDGCNICHDGGGTGTGLLHYYNNTVDMAASDSTYDANAGAAVLGTTTCANVSCHGGITTPDWLTGSIDVNTECTQCHQDGSSAGDPEDNSYYSGKHDKHIREGFSCVTCHDVSTDSNHLNSLNTSAMEGTVIIDMTSSVNITWDDVNSCTGTCHYDPGKTEDHGTEKWVK